MEKPKIIILIDYRSQFWLKSDYKESSFNVSALKENFSELGYEVQIIQFADFHRMRRYFYITILRDPIKRYISEFRHVERGGTWRNVCCNNQ